MCKLLCSARVSSHVAWRATCVVCDFDFTSWQAQLVVPVAPENPTSANDPKRGACHPPSLLVDVMSTDLETI